MGAYIYIYNGAKLSCTNQAVLTDNRLDKSSGYSVPLKIMPSVYEAVAMAHSEVSKDFSASYQFFFDKRNVLSPETYKNENEDDLVLNYWGYMVDWNVQNMIN
ncbi:hypothetical protein NC652_028203 [Populus alba x Populus x berolinensis]|nr:hypothetical protein NC652_028203 [Populus alba x Populus x berolinensis]